jgi:hypothetical protein
MRVCVATANLCTALEFIGAANDALTARQQGPIELGDPLGALIRELHSVACKVALVSRLRGDQRLVFDVAIDALEKQLVDTGIWQLVRKPSRAEGADPD